MCSYDYGNARLRARKSKLLSFDELESLANLRGVDSFISALTKTTYKYSVESALTYKQGMECIREVMNRELSATASDIRKFYDGKDRKYIDITFSFQDLFNIQAIIRGLINEISQGEIEESLLPIGNIPIPVLKGILKSSSVHEAIGKMVTLQINFSQPLLELSEKRGEFTSEESDLALMSWYFGRVNEELSVNNSSALILKKNFRIEADIHNLITIFHILSNLLGQAFSRKRMNDILLSFGNISIELIEEALDQGDILKAINCLKNIAYGEYLQRGFEKFEQTEKISAIEDQLYLYIRKWMFKLPARYPLGIGVPLGYLAMKENEVRNLLWVAKGIQFGIEPNFIKENLERIK